VQELLPAALLLLMLVGMAFAWVDWRLRLRKLPKILGPSWDCPHCGIVNEAELNVCWSCGAVVSRFSLYPGHPNPETWQCRRCRHWNATSRKSCWSCANIPSKQPKRDV
jgi:Zn-finger in Ran binding protein and others